MKDYNMLKPDPFSWNGIEI